MPYIPKTRATYLEYYNLSPNNKGDDLSPNSKGELNYIITTFMVKYINLQGKSYQVISDAIAAAQDAADECKRRVLAPYEQMKLEQPETADPYDKLRF